MYLSSDLKLLTRNSLEKPTDSYVQSSAVSNLFYGGPQVSPQKKKTPDKRKTSAAKEKCSRQKRNWSRQKKKARGKTKIVAAKESNSQKKTKKYGEKSRKHL